MTKKAKILARLIKQEGYSRRAFAEKIGIPATTLQSMLTRGIGRASVDNVIKVCRALGISVEKLEKLAEIKEDTGHKHISLKEENVEYEYISPQNNLNGVISLMRRKNEQSASFLTH